MNGAASPRAPLPVLRTLGGCGGTLVARVLAALPGVVLLSETNPRSAHLYGGMLNPLEQLRTWQPDLAAACTEFDPGEIGYPPRFGAFVTLLRRAVEARSGTLVIRDFNYVDFVGVPFVWPVPSDLSLDAAVGECFAIRDVAVVRHPADQLASLRTHSAIAPVLRADHFLAACNAFLGATRAAPRFRYEDLIVDPAGWFADLCAHFHIPWDARALTNFADVQTVTGYPHRRDQATITACARSAAAQAAYLELRELRGFPELLATLNYT